MVTVRAINRRPHRAGPEDELGGKRRHLAFDVRQIVNLPAQHGRGSVAQQFYGGAVPAAREEGLFRRCQTALFNDADLVASLVDEDAAVEDSAVVSERRGS